MTRRIVLLLEGNGMEWDRRLMLALRLAVIASHDL